MKIIVANRYRKDHQIIEKSLLGGNHQTIHVYQFNELKEHLIKSVDLIILDVGLIGSDLGLFKQVLQEQHRETALLLLVEPIERKLALTIFKDMTAEALIRPFTETQVLAALTRIQEKMNQSPVKRPLGDSNYLLIDQLPSIKKHPAMRKAYGLIKNVSETDITVFITGESGVGKEIFARAVHESSKRNNKKLIGLNCASVPATLLEAELFGSERGAFTGATSRKIGKFELAQKGSLLLDEISEMDLNLQAKLLRVIQEKEMYRLGGEEKINLDVRLIATSNRDLRNWVKQGNFREDLFYRLNVISIHIPPLRERLEDVPILAQHFIDKYNANHPDRKLVLNLDAIEQLCQYNWPGNVRELENILTRTACLTRSNQIKKIYFDEGQDPQFPKLKGNVFTGTIADMERMMIWQALEMHDGNRVRAANQLGVSVRTLRNKLRLYREEANHSLGEIKVFLPRGRNKITSTKTVN